jgi:hypothetical protein
VAVTGADDVTELADSVSATVPVPVVVVVVEPEPVVVQDVLNTLHPASLPPPPQAASTKVSAVAPIRFHIVVVICISDL